MSERARKFVLKVKVLLASHCSYLISNYHGGEGRIIVPLLDSEFELMFLIFNSLNSPRYMMRLILARSLLLEEVSCQYEHIQYKLA